MPARVISGDKVATLARWRLPDVQAPAAVSDGGEARERVSSQLDAQAIDQAHASAHRANAHKEGLAQGLREGLEAANAQIKNDAEHIKSILDALAAPLETLDDTVYVELVELAVAVAQQIVRRELTVDAAQILGVLREARDVLPIATRNIKVLVHPEDAALLRERIHNGDESPGTVLQEDTAVTRGGCRLVTERSTVDATVETRVAKVASQILGDDRTPRS